MYGFHIVNFEFNGWVGVNTKFTISCHIVNFVITPTQNLQYDKNPLTVSIYQYY